MNGSRGIFHYSSLIQLPGNKFRAQPHAPRFMDLGVIIIPIKGRQDRLFWQHQSSYRNIAFRTSEPGTLLHSLILVPSYQGVIKESVRDRVVDSTCCPHAFGCRFAMNTKRKLGSAARVLTVLVRLKSAQTSPLLVLIYQRVYSKPKRPKHPSSGETISQSGMEAYLCLNGGGSFSHAFEDFGENVRPLIPRLRFLFVRFVSFC